MNSKSDNLMLKNIAYLLLALLALIASYSSLRFIPLKSVTVNFLVYLAGSALSIFFLIKTSFGYALMNLFKGSYQEIKKVSWPSKSETVRITIAVLVTIIIVGIMLWMLDAILLKLVGKILGHGG